MVRAQKQQIIHRSVIITIQLQHEADENQNWRPDRAAPNEPQ
jgi:hypothetical protein